MASNDVPKTFNQTSSGANAITSSSVSTDTTPAALIEAGITLFGDRGYDATSTRDLCTLCGANVSAIPYHFGSKQGLYHAVIEHIGLLIHSQVQASVSPRVELIQSGKLMQPVEALRTLEALLGALASVIIANPDSNRWAKLIVREQTSPSAAFEVLYAQHISPMQKILNLLVGWITESNPDDDIVKIKSHSLIGQILGFVVSRESILRSLGCEEFHAHHKELIVNTLMENIRGSLHMSHLDAGVHS